MYGYIFKFTLIPTNLIYVGKHASSEFDKKYYGSGTIWNIVKAEYKLSDIKREVIEWCDSLQELNKKEIYWIDKLNARDPKVGYNSAPGGQGGSSKDTVWYNDGVEEIQVPIGHEMLLPDQWVKGRIPGSLSGLNKDTVWIKRDGIEQKHVKKELVNKYLDNGWELGMLDRGDEWRSHIGKFERTPEIRKISSDTAKKTIANGRNPGWIKNQFKPGEKPINYGQVWITDGIKNVYVNSDDEVPFGWRYGFTMTKKKVMCIETGVIYSWASAASRALKITGVADCCRGLIETAGGYHWEYVED